MKKVTNNRDEREIIFLNVLEIELLLSE
jgi:hypothetical protein